MTNNLYTIIYDIWIVYESAAVLSIQSALCEKSLICKGYKIADILAHNVDQNISRPFLSTNVVWQAKVSFSRVSR